MPYGLEVYHTLLLWSPINDENTPNVDGKNVMVAGLGPAGLLATHYFSKAGAKVIGIDALNIEITPKIKYISENLIEDVALYLNEPLSKRKPSGIGGVMEYGITARWNKNYLDLLVGLLLRRESIKFIGSRRLGGLISCEDVFDQYKFNHLAICIGSAKPKVPFYCKGLFEGYSLTKGVVMASDFLMSLHINRESQYIQNISNTPVYVIGCGLTAIDTACEVRALLKQKGVQNPDVTILYHKEYYQSSAYNINHLEFKKALLEGIKIQQNAKLTEVYKQNGKLHRIELQDGSIYECKMLIIAIGTEPNRHHVIDFLNKENISVFGDCDPKYTGSVVNALASVRNGIIDALSKTLVSNSITENFEEILELPKITTQEVGSGLFEIRIQSTLFAKKVTAGSVIKLQETYKSSIAITVCSIKNNNIIAFLHNTNAETQSLIQAIRCSKTIHINGVNCNKLPQISKDVIIIASKKTEKIFRSIFPQNQILLPHSNIENDCNEYLIAIENYKVQNAVIQRLSRKKYKFIVYNKMNCMLGGICGRCVMPNGRYACLENVE
jgi:hypothetical protein